LPGGGLSSPDQRTGIMILAIDCGSTNHKVALFDEQLNRRATCATPVRYTIRDAERVEFDPEWIWHTTVSLIRQACTQAGISSSSIATIALASQAQTFTLLQSSGEAFMPFVSWADKRASSESAELESHLENDFRFHCSFPSLMPQLELSKLLWIKRRNPGWLTPETRVVSLPSFLTLRLAGLHLTDNNLAGMSGLASCRNNDWWPKALNLCGVERNQMGDLLPLGQRVVARDRCSELSFGSNLQIVSAGNDQTAGAFGNGCRTGKIVLTLGTALVIYRYAGENPGPFDTGGCWGPYPSGGFYELAACDEGCAALDWAVQQMMPGEEGRFFQIAAMAAPGTGLFFPQRMYRTDAWEGSSEKDSMARAVLEGICFRARLMLQQELKLILTGEPICVLGGGSQSEFWLEILANVLDYPVSKGEGDILLGAAMMARPEITPPLNSKSRAILPTKSMSGLYEDRYHAWLSHCDQVSA